MAKSHSSLVLISSLHIVLLFSGARCATLTLRNNCVRTVWPGLMSNAGRSSPPTTGLQLEKGEEKAVPLPPKWSGRLWARTMCATDAAGKFSCVTGNCGSGKMECSGNGATPPATLVEFTLGADGGMDFYDVSLVDGYNVPITVVGKGASAVNCSTAGCESEINGWCPAELRMVSDEGAVVACRSACDAFHSGPYCCSGEYANPNTCGATSYSEAFKKACPKAYSYAYDDSSSTFTCSAADTYLVTFCPSASGSSASPETDGGSSQPTNRRPGGTMVYLGGNHFTNAANTFSIPLLSSAATVLVPSLFRSLGCL